MGAKDSQLVLRIMEGARIVDALYMVESPANRTGRSKSEPAQRVFGKRGMDDAKQLSVSEKC